MYSIMLSVKKFSSFSCNLPIKRPIITDIGILVVCIEGKERKPMLRDWPQGVEMMSLQLGGVR